jgi:hypothetical protein
MSDKKEECSVNETVELPKDAVAGVFAYIDTKGQGHLLELGPLSSVEILGLSKLLELKIEFVFSSMWTKSLLADIKSSTKKKNE